MNKHQAHDIVHQWYGGKASTCPSCTGKMTDGQVMANAKQIAQDNFKPKVNPMIPYDQRLNAFKEDDPKSPIDGGSTHANDGKNGTSGTEDAGSGEADIDADTENQMGELSSKARNNLSDSDFAYIDKQGGRHLPIHDANHVRNALARFNQTHFDSESEKEAAKRKIDAKAK